MHKYLFPIATVVAAVAVGLTGCSGSNAPVKASGRFTYNGKDIPGGIVSFNSEGLGSFNTSLAKDGTYTISDLPEGDFIVTLDTEAVNPDTPRQVYGGGNTGRGNPKGGTGKDAGKDTKAKEAAKAGKAAGSEKLAKQAEASTNERRKAEAGTGFGPPPIEERRALYMKIPEKYSDKAKTDLKVTLKRGMNSGVNFDLKD